MAVESTFECHGCAGHSGLQAGDCAVMALACGGLGGLLTVMLYQSLQLAAAAVERVGKIQCDIGRVIVVGLAKFVRPIIEQLPFVGALFRNLNRVSVHIFVASLRTWMRVTCFMHPLVY